MTREEALRAVVEIGEAAERGRAQVAQTEADATRDEALLCPFKTRPYDHQRAEFLGSRDAPTRALFWEMGTGKTKPVLDTAAHLFLSGKIDGLLVLAPNGVHQNWVTDEIPLHLPQETRALVHAYASNRAKTKWHRAAVERLLGHREGLACLAMSYDVFRTLAGRKVVEKFLRVRRTLYVLDESQRIKSPGAKRTISVVATGRRAAYKRILTGTPVTNKPFDVYAQLKFLDEDFWRARGLESYDAFKVQFGNWVDRVVESKGGRIGRFSEVKSFKNLDQLAGMVAEVASRVLKKDVLDLPPKVYQKRYFELCPEQERAYEELREEFVTLLDSGASVTVPLMISRLLRLQQLTCGFLPEDLTGKINRFPENPRLRLLEEVLADADCPAIVFARFREDVDQICALLGDQAVRYDGAVKNDDRLANRQAFQRDGTARYFVANPAAAATGLTLTRASLVVYYSNSFDLELRLQSEDRAHRAGQEKTVTYVDLLAHGTVDVQIVAALRRKLDVASQITRDEVRAWI